MTDSIETTDEQVKEFKLEATKVFRARGVVKVLRDTEFINWMNLRVVEEPIVLMAGVDCKCVGAARLYLRHNGNHNDGTGSVEIVADVMVDYATAERLLAENGELGLSIDVGLTNPNRLNTFGNMVFSGRYHPEMITVSRATLFHAPPGSEGLLTAEPFDWSSFFI